MLSFDFSCAQKEKVPTHLKNNYKKEEDKTDSERGCKRLMIIQIKIHRNRIQAYCLLSIFFSGQEQCLSGKPVKLSNEENRIVSVYLDLRKEFEINSIMDKIEKCKLEFTMLDKVISG